MRQLLVAALCAAAGAFTASVLAPAGKATPPLPEIVPSSAKRPPAKATAETLLAAFLREDTPPRQITAALALGENASPREIRALLEQSHRFPATGARQIAVATLLRRWLAQAPTAALEYCRHRQASFLPQLIGSYAVTHPDEAEAFLLKLPRSEMRKVAWRELAFALPPKPPDKVWDLMERSRRSEKWVMDDYGFLTPLVKKLAAADVEEALARLDNLPEELASMTRHAVGQTLAETDPARAWRWVGEQKYPRSEQEGVLDIVVKKSPGDALRLLAELSAEDQLEILKGNSTWGIKDVSAMLAALKADTSLPPESKQALALRLFRESADRDPAAAAPLLTLGEAALRPGDFSGLFWEWAREDPAAGEAWVASLPEGKIRDTATEAWRERMESRARDQEEEAAEAAKPGHRSLLSVWDTGEPVLDVWEKLGRMTPEQLNAEISANERITKDRALASLAFVNPAAGAAWLQTWTINEKNGPNAAKFAAEWGRADPAAAAAWVTTLPAGALANTAANNVARQYQRYAPAEAEAWVKTLPAGLIQDSARKGMAE